jgi:hypothetical protein
MISAMRAAPFSEPGSGKGHDVLDVTDGPDGPAALANLNHSNELTAST